MPDSAQTRDPGHKPPRTARICLMWWACRSCAGVEALTTTTPQGFADRVRSTGQLPEMYSASPRLEVRFPPTIFRPHRTYPGTSSVWPSALLASPGPPNTGVKLRGPGRRRRPVTERALQDVPVHGALGQDLVSFIALLGGAVQLQFSIFSPSTCAKCFVLFVTTVSPR